MLELCLCFCSLIDLQFSVCYHTSFSSHYHPCVFSTVKSSFVSIGIQLLSTAGLWSSCYWWVLCVCLQIKFKFSFLTALSAMNSWYSFILKWMTIRLLSRSSEPHYNSTSHHITHYHTHHHHYYHIITILSPSLLYHHTITITSLSFIHPHYHTHPPYPLLTHSPSLTQNPSLTCTEEAHVVLM